MDLIDDEGNLFGLVNVVDVLVVLLAVAVVAAGVALVNPFASSEEATRYATLDLGERPAYVAELVSEGDVLSPSNSGANVTVTDVYVTPSGDENATVTVRVRMDGQLVESEQTGRSVFSIAGTAIQRGTGLRLGGDDYTIDGTVRSYGESRDSLRTGETAIITSSRVSTATAETISRGDAFVVGGETVATITDVHVGPGDGSDVRRVTVGATVETLNRSGPFFASQRVSIGRELTFRSGGYEMTGEVNSIGNATVRTGTASVVLRASVSSETAQSIREGDAYQIAGNQVARITDVRAYPSSSDGQRTVFLGVDLTTASRNGTQTFGGKTVSIGAPITVQTTDYSVSGRVEELGTNSIETSSAEVVVKSTVAPETAEVIDPGDSYRVAGSSIATVESVTTYPAANGQQTVVLGMTLATIDRSDGQYVGDRLVQVGATIPFQTDSYRLTGNVVTRGSLSLPGESTTRSVEVQLESVAPEVAESLSAGMVARSEGSVSARVTDAEVDAAVITLTSDSGDIYRREHPIQKDVVLTVELSGRMTPSGLYFRSDPLQVGRTVLFDFSTVTVQGTVVRIPPTSATNSTGTSVVA
jgi:ribosomal 50S subunit-recycling heat shock protein